MPVCVCVHTHKQMFTVVMPTVSVFVNKHCGMVMLSAGMYKDTETWDCGSLSAASALDEVFLGYTL